ncbi:oligosaccharide flippase family protein [Acinetobacter radioresistens]|uniref:oligosaccharide flippase family protein n=1 Tax=Acinetobacter radioresistens TaxID=40216 RepID=UPI00061937C0|nr:oligosaccharide flippase family protein [Acinetobacter radioresistens]
MSLKKNIIANYASQLYVTGLGILILPLYIKYMGAEAYGLVGFFTMLQAWFAVLDLGLTPTIGRETARYFGGSMSALAYRQLFRALSVIFIFIAVLGGGGLFIFAKQVAGGWLQIATLSIHEVLIAVQIMAISVALRWLGGLYRGVITGAERLVWLSGFNTIIATLRFIAVFATMNIFGYTPLVFFLHQLIVVLIEIIGLYWMANLLLPKKNTLTQAIGWSIKPITPLLKFALTIAFTSSVWVFVTQTDKLVLSGILPLAEYGYFTLAVLVANAIIIISGPVSSAIMPRMANLHAQSKREEMLQVYRNGTQIVSVLAGTASLVIAFYPKQLLFAWTGDLVLAEAVAPILRLYALGNALLAVGAFPYYLQYALGNLRYHLTGNIIMVVLLIPSIIWAATHFGGIGAGYAWLGMNLFYFIVWVGYVHRNLAPKLHLSWLFKDVILIYLSVIGFLTLLNLIGINMEYENRFFVFITIIAVSCFAIVIAAISSNSFRHKIFKKF